MATSSSERRLPTLCRRATMVLTALVISALPSRAAADPCDLGDLEERFHEIVSQVQRGVVSVVAYSEPEAAADRSADGMQSVRQSVGSGVIIDGLGHVLTTHSVIGESRTLVVRTHDEVEHPAVFLGADPLTDLALLLVSDAVLTPVSLGDAATLEEGCWLFTVGQPGGEYPDRSFGSFRARTPASATFAAALLQMTAPVFPGQTGGAVVDVHGKVVGLLLGEISSEPAAGLAHPALAHTSAAIPIGVARRVAVMLAEHGTASPGYLGVKVRMPTKELKVLLNFEQGVLIDELVAGSPAESAGLEPGDIILAFEGAPVYGPAELVRLVNGKRPGDHCSVLLLRGDVKLSRSVTLGAVPADLRMAAIPRRSAVVGGELTDEQIADRIQKLEGEIDRLRAHLASP